MMMRRIAIVFFLCVGCLAGCLERNERLAIRPDGSLYLELRYQSPTPNDIYEGDAVPRPGGGWAVEERTSEDADGLKSYELYAVTVIDSDSALPSSYAAPGEEALRQPLRFPTELVIEQRADGVYYHIRRTYESRRWSYVEMKRREIVEEPLKRIEGRDLEDLSDDERGGLLRASARFEIEKSLIFAREAHLEVAPDLPQDWWLAFADDMRRLVDEVDYTRLIQITHNDDDRMRSDQFDAEMERWTTEVDARMKKSATEVLGYSRTQFNSFMHAFEVKKNEFAVTEDLGDDVFKITIEMPGEIVASNGGGVGGDTATWQFTGQQLRDHSVELLVTSVVRN